MTNLTIMAEFMIIIIRNGPKEYNKGSMRINTDQYFTEVWHLGKGSSTLLCNISKGKLKTKSTNAKIAHTHLAVATVHSDLVLKGKYKAKNFSIDMNTSKAEE